MFPGLKEVITYDDRVFSVTKREQTNWISLYILVTAAKVEARCNLT